MASVFNILNALKIKKNGLVILSVICLSGCGGYHYNHLANEDGGAYNHQLPVYRIWPGQINNNQYHSLRHHINQNIHNSINISGQQYQEVELSQSRIFYKDANTSNHKEALDGTVNQMVVEERKSFRVPVCRSVMQSVNAAHYNSFQSVNCP